MKIVVLFAIIILIFSACDNSYKEKELYGAYVPIDYKNTFDTIILKPNGEYNRKIYNKNNKRVLDMNGEWEFKNSNRLKIEGFYLNLDDDLIKFPNSINDTDMSIDTYFETQNSVIKFCVGYHHNGNCYKKIN
ncbi:MAG: hypothetical protein ABJB05_01340 [Parafilimonas sp.]